MEVYPRPSGEIYICGIGGSDYISQEDLKAGAFLQECNAKEDRVKAATNAFQSISKTYQDFGELDRVQACMRPCPPDAMPYMGSIPTFDGAYINAGKYYYSFYRIIIFFVIAYDSWLRQHNTKGIFNPIIRRPQLLGNCVG